MNTSSSLLRSLVMLSTLHLIVIASDSICIAADIESHVTEVTLFPDQAFVTREGRVTLHPGDNSILFSPIPQSVTPDSLKVNGKGEGKVTILGANLLPKHQITDSSPRVEEIKNRIVLLQEQQKVLQLKEDRLTTLRQSLLRVNFDLGPPSSEIKGTDATKRQKTPKELYEVFQFANVTSGDIEGELATIRQSSRDLQRQIDVANKELGSLSSNGNDTSVVEVFVNAEKEGSAIFELQYQVQQTSWRPEYSLYAKPASSEFRLETYGVISQTTGEDWNAVKLHLSTARPSLRLHRPEPLPQYLRVREPVEAFQRSDARGGVAAAPQAMRMKALMKDSSEEAGAVNEVLSDMEEQEASFTQGERISFDIPAEVSLKSDGSSKKIRLVTQNLPATVRSIVVSDQSLDVFEEARLKNSGPASLLPGMVSLFRDNTYVGRQNLAFIRSGEEWNMPIGLSELFQVQREKVKDFEEDPGIVRSFRRIMKEFNLNIEYLGNTQRELILLEGAPVSQNEKISVEVTAVDPVSLPEKDAARINKTPGVLEWHLMMKPKEKKTIHFGTKVEFPKEISVSGIK